jgi:hypothetical protein
MLGRPDVDDEVARRIYDVIEKLDLALAAIRRSPAAGSKYAGPPRTASVDGVVTAIYHSSVGDTAGADEVIAKGNQGTTAHANFRIRASGTTQTDTSLDRPPPQEW